MKLNFSVTKSILFRDWSILRKRPLLLLMTHVARMIWFVKWCLSWETQPLQSSLQEALVYLRARCSLGSSPFLPPSTGREEEQWFPWRSVCSSRVNGVCGKLASQKDTWRQTMQRNCNVQRLAACHKFWARAENWAISERHSQCEGCAHTGGCVTLGVYL